MYTLVPVAVLLTAVASGCALGNAGALETSDRPARTLATNRVQVPDTLVRLRWLGTVHVRCMNEGYRVWFTVAKDGATSEVAFAIRDGRRQAAELDPGERLEAPLNGTLAPMTWRIRTGTKAGNATAVVRLSFADPCRITRTNVTMNSTFNAHFS